jgi:chromosome segregation ATPase
MYQKYEECGRDLAMAQDDIKKLREKVEGPRGHVQMDLDKITELEEARHKLSKKFYNLKMELDKKNELLKNSEDRIKMLKQKLDEVQANTKGKGKEGDKPVANTKGKGKEGDKPVAPKGVNREVQRLKNQITEHKKTIDDLEKTLEQCRKERNWTEQTTQLQQELEDVKKKYKKTSEKMNDTEKAALDCGSDLEECVEARTEERMRANRAESEAREARKDVKKAKEALERWVKDQEKRTGQASGAGSRSGAGTGAESVAVPS